MGNTSLKFTEFILKFTENAKKWLSEGGKGGKRGENDEINLLTF